MAEAHEAIRNLLGRYCQLMDAADWTAVGELFSRARLIEEHGHLVAEGADGVRVLYEGGTLLHDGRPGTRHMTANPVIDLDEQESVATVHSSYVVFQAAPGLALQPIIAGRYRDRFSGAGGEWHFVERCFYVDQVGDLSHHLVAALRP